VARGWESKSVEEQIDSAKARRNEHRVKLTPEQIDVERKRDALQLQRTRVLKEISNCNDPRYRKTLENGLEYLEKQIAALG
jgi:hypothetical protein